MAPDIGVWANHRLQVGTHVFSQRPINADVLADGFNQCARDHAKMFVSKDLHSRFRSLVVMDILYEVPSFTISGCHRVQTGLLANG